MDIKEKKLRLMMAGFEIKEYIRGGKRAYYIDYSNAWYEMTLKMNVTNPYISKILHYFDTEKDTIMAAWNLLEWENKYGYKRKEA